MRERFSVAMCVYGGDNPEHFKQAVNSIWHQTVQPDEVVVVVDGPVTQEMEQVIAGFETWKNVKVIRLIRNMGHGEARRIGLENCSHELVALMDADDLSVPDRFEKQLAVFAKCTDVSVVGGNIAEFIDNEKNIIGYRLVPETNDEISAFMRTRCPMNQVTVMFRKSDVFSVGGYCDWYCNEDYYLWIRMYLQGLKFTNITDVLVNVRIGEEMYRRRGGISYFLSEERLQRYMLSNHVISLETYLCNVVKRAIVQVLLPARLRGYVFRRFAREKLNG